MYLVYSFFNPEGRTSVAAYLLIEKKAQDLLVKMSKWFIIAEEKRSQYGLGFPQMEGGLYPHTRPVQQ